MKISLISYTQEPEKLITLAAKLCYSNYSINQTQEKIDNSQIQNFINMLLNMKHESPLEHINFTFSIEGVSRAFLAQITRHRIASYSVQSQRYVKESQFEYIIPPEIENIKEAKEQFILSMKSSQEYYNKITQILIKNYNNNLNLSNNLTEKKAIEDARFVLPNSCETKMICTFNARSLLNLFSHRCCNRAQWEIRLVAIEMLKLVTKIAPNVFSKAGPPCVRDKCTEGKMSCKESVKIKEFFENIKNN